MTAQILASELANLVQDSKRKNTELRNAAEKSLQDLKSLTVTSEAQLTAGRFSPGFQFSNPLRPFLRLVALFWRQTIPITSYQIQILKGHSILQRLQIHDMMLTEYKTSPGAHTLFRHFSLPAAPTMPSSDQQVLHAYRD